MGNDRPFAPSSEKSLQPLRATVNDENKVYASAAQCGDNTPRMAPAARVLISSMKL